MKTKPHPLPENVSALSDEVAALKSQGVFKRLVKAVRYSNQGFKAAWQNEAAFRSEAVLAVLALVLAFATPFTAMQRLVLLASWVLVIIVELLNSAIEAVVDLTSPALHPLAGRAKDMGSAAVMGSMVLAAAVWGWVAVPVWWSLLRQ